jgi:hypothetical protein
MGNSRHFVLQLAGRLESKGFATEIREVTAAEIRSLRQGGAASSEASAVNWNG